jgi:exodeoxyribonuclease-5
MNDIVFNDQQSIAMSRAEDWYKNWHARRHNKQVFFLAGFAGTGKTTCAFEIAHRCCGSILPVEFIAPTGKAASRLRQKGCHHARTMHQFIYRLRGEDDEGNPIFGARDAIDGRPPLIILDEASMVGQSDYNNLIKHGVPMLALGDIGQLPPVKAVAMFTEGHQDVLLDKIERNGGKIIEASMYVRQGHKLPMREYDDVRVRRGDAPLEELVAHAGENAQVLCAFNNTRDQINRAVRKELGFTDPLPMPGEKILCRFNQHGMGIMNGEQGIVLRYEQIDTRHETSDTMYEDEEDDGSRIWIRSLTDGLDYRVKFKKESFDRNFDVRKEAQKKPGGFDFGYAMTVHSAQGSEWPNVLVIEQDLRGVPYNKLMYTAVTRAQKQLTVYRS